MNDSKVTIEIVQYKGEHLIVQRIEKGRTQVLASCEDPGYARRIADLMRSFWTDPRPHDVPSRGVKWD